jgi:ribosomal protein S18 acetylase RimI-like enzyme
VTFRVREAGAADAEAICALSRALSAEEGCGEPQLSVADVLREGFGERPRFRALLAEEDGRAIGYALFYPSYDTDHAARGCYLQDLYVAPKGRRRGVGRALMAAVASACAADGGLYLFWNARPRNVAARAFYRSIGAREEPVLTLSLQPDALHHLAAEA